MSQEEPNQSALEIALEEIKAKRSMLKLQTPASCARKTLPEMIRDMKTRLTESRKLEALFKNAINDKPNK